MRDPIVTHKIMSAVKSKNTKPELLLRRALWKRGMRFRVNYKALPGKPDIVFTKVKLAVFCDGDFWHGNNWAIRGLSCLEEELERYDSYWRNKILTNIERDKKKAALLEENGWVVIRVWESEIKKNLEEVTNQVIETYYKLNNNQTI